VWRKITTEAFFLCFFDRLGLRDTRGPADFFPTRADFVQPALCGCSMPIAPLESFPVFRAANFFLADSVFFFTPPLTKKARLPPEKLAPPWLGPANLPTPSSSGRRGVWVVFLHGRFPERPSWAAVFPASPGQTESAGFLQQRSGFNERTTRCPKFFCLSHSPRPAHDPWHGRIDLAALPRAELVSPTTLAVLGLRRSRPKVCGSEIFAYRLGPNPAIPEFVKKRPRAPSNRGHWVLAPGLSPAPNCFCGRKTRTPMSFKVNVRCRPIVHLGNGGLAGFHFINPSAPAQAGFVFTEDCRCAGRNAVDWGKLGPCFPLPSGAKGSAAGPGSRCARARIRFVDTVEHTYPRIRDGT